jgi:hypothetical protein
VIIDRSIKHSNTVDFSVDPEPRVEEEDIQPMKRLQAYLDSCSYLGITPVTYLSRQMSNKGLLMRSHSIGPQGARALAIALLVSRYRTITKWLLT